MNYIPPINPLVDYAIKLGVSLNFDNMTVPFGTPHSMIPEITITGRIIDKIMGRELKFPEHYSFLQMREDLNSLTGKNVALQNISFYSIKTDLLEYLKTRKYES